jgi:hypothetical protein
VVEWLQGAKELIDSIAGFTPKRALTPTSANDTKIAKWPDECAESTAACDG